MKDISAVEVPTEEGGVPALHEVPQPRVPVPEKVVPITSDCKNQWRFWLSEMVGFWSPRHSS